MSLTAAKMSEEVWLTCLTHALSTETEEIMGLLLGDIQYSSNGKATALIWGASPQTRSDRRKDRVETNPEQLAAASAQAERMTLTTGRTTRVIGWYHSHPHITVLPSHVDVRTQAMYQLLDAGFIGLIFSCFSEDARKVGRIQVIAFQSLDGKQKHTLKTPLPVSSANSSSVAEPGLSWGSTDILQSTSGSGRLENFEQETADSKQAVRAVKVGGRPDSPSHLEEFFAHADGRGQMEVDSIDTSSSMQEALHLSNLDMRGADYVRKEIPLQVLPASALLELDSSLTSFTDLQNVLFEEERAAYSQAITQSTRDGKIHPFAFIHHTSTYQASMCKLMEYCLSPAINSLQDRLKENEIRLAMLMEEAKALEVEAFNRGSSPTFDSARHGFRRSFSSGQGDINATIGIGGRSRKAP